MWEFVLIRMLWRQRDAHVLELARVLGWAAQRGIPLEQAVAALRAGTTHYVLLAFTGSFPAGMAFGFVFRPSFLYYEGLRRVTLGLLSGQSLSDCLRWHLRAFLPDYYLAAVEEAEATGRLGAVLPLLADRIALTGSPANTYLRPPVVMATYLGPLCFFAPFGIIFLLPKFLRMGYEMGVGFPVVLLWAMRAFEMLRDWHLDPILTVAMFGGGPALLFCLWFYPSFGVLRNLGEAVCLLVPGVRSFVRRERALELTQCLAAGLALGLDLPRAATWAAKHSRNWWLRARLRRYAALLNNGVDWFAAWRQLRLGGALEDWVLGGSRRREDPRAGFDALAAVLRARQQQAATRLWIVARVGATLLLGVLVGTFVIAIHLAIRSLVIPLLGWE